jgi:hypothetical protein
VNKSEIKLSYAVFKLLGLSNDKHTPKHPRKGGSVPLVCNFESEAIVVTIDILPPVILLNILRLQLKQRRYIKLPLLLGLCSNAIISVPNKGLHQ